MSGKGFPGSGGGSGFPNASKSSRQSAFEKQKAEAEAKRQREAAETAAVYEDFVKSFDRDDGHGHGHDDHSIGSRRGGSSGFGERGGHPRQGFGGMQGGGGGGGSRRHFGASSGLKSGPGSLGPAPSGFGKKRSFQDFAKNPSGPQRDRNNTGFEDRGGQQQQQQQQQGASLSKAFATSDDEDMGEAQDREEEKAVARPTLRLSNVPPGTSPATIKAMLPANLAVENVKILPPPPPSMAGGATERRNLVVIVTMSPETPATDMDAAVSALQNRYMGYGYYLALHRHLSSAVASSAALPNLGSSGASSHPFGAKPVEQPGGGGGKDTQQQQNFHRGFAPPTSYGPNYVAINRANILHVPVKPPQDVRTIQLINMVIEGVLEHGPEFEALLMSRPEVQREEKWAWLWDARSDGGIWLRWRLWEVVTGAQPKTQRGKYVPLFDGAHAWKSPDKSLPYEYTTRLDEFASDSEYNSSDEEQDMEDEANRDADESGRSFLNPLDKAKVTHLLARLPTSMARLRKGDVARITAFAIMHTNKGVDEVVDMLVGNIERPLSLAAANPERERDRERENAAAAKDSNGQGEAADLSGASLVGLYVVSDVLSASASSGVRHAWRYRQLIEAALKARGTFGALGGMAERQGWGRLRAEKWKRSVGLVLNLWEGWCVFPAESQALFARSFENPPSTKAAVDEEATEKQAQEGEKDGRWNKLVDAKPSSSKEETLQPLPKSEMEGEPTEEDDVAGEPIQEDDVEGEPIEEDDVEGEPIEEDDIEGEPIDEDDIAGEPIEDDDVAGEPMDEDEAVGVAVVAGPGPEQASGASGAPPPGPSRAGSGLGQPRRRMRAADMFADSDEESTG